MRTRVLKIDSLSPQPELIGQAVKIIHSGGLCAFPTETVYGLGANGLSEGAVAGIFKAKGRPGDNPLILHISKMDQLFQLCTEVPPEALELALRFWPGPLTLVLKRTEKVPDVISGGLETVAVRMPAHAVALALIEASGVPIAAPSANLSGRPSPTLAKHVLEDLEGRVDMILDGGDCPVGLESTVVNLSGEKPVLLRPGGITREQLLEVLEVLEVDAGILTQTVTDQAVSSPGMKYLHYAPSAPLTLIRGENDRVIAFLREHCAPDTGILCFEDELALFFPAVVRSLGDETKPDKWAKNLFSALRSFDQTKVTRIYARCPGENGIGLAVQNRLLRAAGFKTIDL